MDTDVLIVGAGPTGLMLAIQLARRGVRPIIIDRHSGPAQQSRAMGVQARTLEIYAKLGLDGRALELGRRGNGANMWAQGTRRARIPVGDIGRDLSPFPFVLMLGQDDNEHIMGELLDRLGVTVQWNTALLALTQQPDRVAATIRRADGSLHKIDAGYVAGCDGAHSTVRDLTGITFPGAPYEQVFFVADTEATGSMVPEELNIYMWRNGFHLLFPMHGHDHWRVIGVLPKHLRERTDVRWEEVMPSVKQEAGADLTFKACRWFSVYRSHHRCAERFRNGRCFLLGDAAHIHSPAGAQGMNTGLQDAYNLAWKLALVLQGRAGARLLDSYERERIPVAQRLLRTTDRAFKLLVSESWGAGLFRTRIITRIAAFAMTRPRIRELAFRTIAQLGIRYRRSPLSRTLAGLAEQSPRAGDRFPWLKVRLRVGGPIEDLFAKLDDRRFSLVVIGQPVDAAALRRLPADIETVVVPADADNAEALARKCLVSPSFYLLRPDGHVALAGGVFDPIAVIAYLEEQGIRSEPHLPVHSSTDLVALAH